MEFLRILSHMGWNLSKIPSEIGSNPSWFHPGWDGIPRDSWDGISRDAISYGIERLRNSIPYGIEYLGIEAREIRPHMGSNPRDCMQCGVEGFHFAWDGIPRDSTPCVMEPRGNRSHMGWNPRGSIPCGMESLGIPSHVGRNLSIHLGSSPFGFDSTCDVRSHLGSNLLGLDPT